MSNLVALLLVVMASRHYGVYLAEPEARADVWNILGGAAIMILAARAWWTEGRTSPQSFALIVLGAHELPVIAASAAWMVSPWQVPDGAGMLSAWAGVDLSRIGALLVMLVVVHIARNFAPVNSDR